MNKRVRYICLVTLLATTITPQQTTYSGSVVIEGSKSTDSDTVWGSGTYTNVERTSLSVSGSLTFSHLTTSQGILVSGSASGEALRCRNLRVSGSLSGNEIACAQLSVSGSLTGKNIDCDSYAISGAFLVFNFTATSGGEVCGRFFAQNSSCRALTWRSDQGASGKTPFVAENCSFDTITVKSESSNWNLLFFLWRSPSTPKIILKGSSRVTGNIIFEKESGVIELWDEARVDGKIINGSIEKKKS